MIYEKEDGSMRREERQREREESYEWMTLSLELQEKQMQSAKNRERDREREKFHQLKKRRDGGNILNGCSMGVEAERKGKSY